LLVVGSHFDHESALMKLSVLEVVGPLWLWITLYEALLEE
jgi:hypothetical protein